MIKTLWAVAIFIFSCSTVFAQTPFVPTTGGMKLEYVQKDKNGKVAGYSTSTVVDISTVDGDTIITILSDSADADGKPIDQLNQLLTMYRISGDKVYALKETLIPPLEKMMPAEAAQDLETFVKGNDTEFPYTPVAGQKLPDNTVEIWGKDKTTEKTNKFFTMIYSERKIVAQEDVTTEAGTFNCCKVYEKIKLKAILGLGGEVIYETWYAPGIGVVQQTTYDKKMKPNGVRELISVSGRI